jgi:hypothetical protein
MNRLDMLKPTFDNFIQNPSFGMPVLGHVANLPPTLMGLLTSMIPQITPDDSPALREAIDLGAGKAWEDRPDINPFIKMGANIGAGLATTGPLVGAGIGALNLPRSLAGLGMALNFADDAAVIGLSALQGGKPKQTTQEAYWGQQLPNNRVLNGGGSLVGG